MDTVEPLNTTIHSILASISFFQVTGIINKIIFKITKEGEIWIEGKKNNLNAIQGITDVFRNGYPDGSVIISCENDSLNELAIKALDQVRAAKVKMVIIAAER